MVIVGSLHQAHPRFRGSGTQCTVNVFIALLTANRLSPEQWNSNTIDGILIKGDNLHSSILETRTLQNTYFLVDDLPCFYDGYELELSKPISGAVFPDFLEDPFNTLDVILEASKTARFAFLTIGACTPAYTTGLIFDSGKGWVFDPHSRGQDGLCQPNGTAVLSEHKIENLKDFIRKLCVSLNLGDDCPFELTKANITMDSQSDSSFSGFDDEDVKASERKAFYIKDSSLVSDDDSSMTNSYSSSDDIPLAQIIRAKICTQVFPSQTEKSQEHTTFFQLNEEHDHIYENSNKDDDSSSSSSTKENKTTSMKRKIKRKKKISYKEHLDNSDEDIPLAQVCFDDAQVSSDSEYKFSSLEQKIIQTGISTSDLSDTDSFDMDKDNIKGQNIMKKRKNLKQKTQRCRLAEKKSNVQNDFSQNHPEEHTYCAPSYAFPEINNANHDSMTSNVEVMADLDGYTFDFPSEQYVHADNENSQYIIEDIFMDNILNDYENIQFVDEYGNELPIIIQEVDSTLQHETLDDQNTQSLTIDHANQSVGSSVQTELVSDDNNGRDGRSLEKSLSRKRMRNPGDWSRNIRKKLRNSGHEYTNAKGHIIQRRKIGTGCGDKCRFKCKEKFNQTEREQIFHCFWGTGDINRQRDFILQNSHATETKVKTKTTSHTSRSKSFTYSFDQKRVCKTFFMATLNISDQVIYTAHKKAISNQVSSQDNRGKHDNRKKTSSEDLQNIRSHIESFPRMESHYCRKQSKKEYLESNLSIKKMYELFSNQYHPQDRDIPSFYVYNQVFNKEYNLSFFRPKKDQCDFCSSYKNSNESQKLELKDDYESHIKNKDISRENKENDKIRAKNESDSLVVSCFDLEQILLTPRIFASSAYYRRKLNSLNFTIYNLGTSDGNCYIWHEGIAGRGANEIASCIFHYIQSMSNLGRKRFIFYSDNCASQNKNTYYATMLWYALQRFDLQSIEHKYLEKGHTQNENDSIHSSIESASRNIPVYTTPQWASTIQLARHGHPYQVKEMSLSDFFDFKEISKYLKNFDMDLNRNKVSWLAIRTLKISSASPNNLHIQYDYDGAVHELNLSQRLRRITSPPPKPSDIVLNQLRQEPIPISNDKYTDLEHLCRSNLIPQVHHSFFLSLEHGENK